MVQQPMSESLGHKTRSTFSLSFGVERPAETSEVTEKRVKRESSAPFPCKRMAGPRASGSPAGQCAWEVSAGGRQLHQDGHCHYRQLLPMLHS